MRKILNGHLTACVRLAALTGLIHCTNPFESQLERIDSFIRTLSFTYTNHRDSTLAEAAPGDTVTVHAYFAGDTAHRVEWYIAYGDSMWGSDKKPISMNAHENIMNTSRAISDSLVTRADIDTLVHDRATATFLVDPHIMRTNSYIEQRWEQVLSENKLDALPREFHDLGIDEVVMFIETALALDSMVNDGAQIEELTDRVLVLLENVPALQFYFERQVSSYDLDYALAQYYQLVTALIGYFTLPVTVFTVVDDIYYSRSTYTIRYHSRIVTDTLAAYGILPSKNPVVDRIVCTRTPGIGAQYQPDSIFVLYDRSDQSVTDTILIDTDNTYHLVALARPQTVDLPDNIDADSIGAEQVTVYQWFYHTKGDMTDTPSDRLMQLKGILHSHFVEFVPPRRIQMDSFTLWVRVQRSNILYFGPPFGYSLEYARVNLRYTERYRERMGEN
jgi:hypothetical protein